MPSQTSVEQIWGGDRNIPAGFALAVNTPRLSLVYVVTRVENEYVCAACASGCSRHWSSQPRLTHQGSRPQPPPPGGRVFEADGDPVLPWSLPPPVFLSAENGQGRANQAANGASASGLNRSNQGTQGVPVRAVGPGRLRPHSRTLHVTVNGSYYVTRVPSAG